MVPDGEGENGWAQAAPVVDRVRSAPGRSLL